MEIVTGMDQIISSFAQGMRMQVPNDSHFSLEYNEHTQQVISKQFIPAGSCLGQIYGEPMYIWDISHSQYMFVDEDMVLDISKNVPRTILTLVRDDNETDNHNNCMIQVEQDNSCFHNYFFLYSTRDIQPGDEIVNAVPSYR